MSKLVTLDEIEEYENELKRAHAENRVPALHDPRIVASENLGNAECHLVEKSAALQKAETRDLLKARKDALKQDQTLRKVILGNTQRTELEGGVTQPYQAPDPEKHAAPKSKEEKEFAERQVDGLFAKKNFDDFGSDQNIPNLTTEGEVLGDSVNRVFTRNMTTQSPDDLIFENERNSVPVPERFRNENPPLVIQQSNPVTGEAPVDTPRQIWRQITDEDAARNPSTDDVPHTAISVPYPEHVIGDETGTTRDPSRESERFIDSSEELNDTEPPVNVPISQSQVFQGAVKRPETMPGGEGSRPADDSGLRPVENDAQKAAQNLRDEIIEAARKDEADRGERMVSDREAANAGEPNTPELEMERFNQQQESQTEPEQTPEEEETPEDTPDEDNNPENPDKADTSTDI